MARFDQTLTPDQISLSDVSHPARIFLEGPAGAGKTTAAVARLMALLQAGVSGNSILILAPQRTLLVPFETALRGADAPPGGLPTLLTIGGLARRMVDLFWPLAASEAGFAHPDERPVFLTLETAQYYLAHLVRPLIEEQHLFDSVVIQRNRMYSQILDNLNKAAVVGFPHLEIGSRLKDSWIGEPGQLRVYDDVQLSANVFRNFCLEHNLLDYSLQIEIFRKSLWQHPACRDHLVSAFRCLLYDNVEEDTPAAHDLILEWLPDFDSALLTFDWQAGYRRFLGADPTSAYRLKSVCTESRSFPVSLIQNAGVRSLETRLSNVLSRQIQPHFLFTGEAQALPPSAVEEIDSRFGEFFQPKVSRFYPEMLDWVADSIADLVAEGVAPGEIVVIAPYLSDALRFSLIERLKTRGVPVRSHRPSRSLREEPAVECLLTLAALAHPEWGILPSHFDVAYSLVQAIQDLDLVRAQLLEKIIYHPTGGGFWLSSFDRIVPDMQERITYRLGERYEKLRSWLDNSRAEPAELDHFLSRLFGELLSQPGFGFHTHYDTGQAAANLIESVQKFRWVAGPLLEAEGVPTGKEYLLMVQDGVIAAQYLEGWRVHPEGAVLLAPAYTFLMANRPVDVQFWLDVGSRGWVERLLQPLTHPYVLSLHWPASLPWSETDEYAAGSESLRRLVLGLLRRCRRGIYLGLSELNEQGYEGRGPLLAAFQRLLRETAAVDRGE